MTVVILLFQFVAAFAVSVACRVLDREGVNMAKSREAGTQCPHTISTLWGQRRSTVSTTCREWPYHSSWVFLPSLHEHCPFHKHSIQVQDAHEHKVSAMWLRQH